MAGLAKGISQAAGWIILQGIKLCVGLRLGSTESNKCFVNNLKKEMILLLLR